MDALLAALRREGGFQRPQQVDLQVGGDLKLVDDKGKPSTLPMSALSTRLSRLRCRIARFPRNCC